MKLLTAPVWTQEVIESAEEPVPFVETRMTFNPLGLIGVGALFKTKQVRTMRSFPGVRFPGRSTAIEVEIDFEAADAWAATWIVDGECYERTQQNRDGYVLEYGGRKFHIYGILPRANLHDNVWRCSMDHFKELERGTGNEV